MTLPNQKLSESNGECPDQAQWLMVLTGCASGDQVSALEAHLAQCGACETTLDAIVEDSDTCVRTLAACPSVSEDEPEYQQLYAQLMAVPHSFSGSTSMQQLINRLPAAARASGVEDSIPRQLGQYELLEPIGRGATGSVFKARHLKLDRIVALKALAPRRSNDPGSVARFLREMKAVGRLDHPHIIRATDAGESRGRHYLVMEYVEGTSVSSLLHRLQPLAVADACEIARQAALGLACAHQHGMVHRDVKPSNLLFAYSGQVKLLDLGLVAIQDGAAPSNGAAWADGAEGPDGHSQLDGPCDDVTRGTADYMSPEQWTRYHDVDARSDLYSLGCTLFKLLTGVAPYHQLPIGCANTMQAHLSGEVPDVGALRVDLPAGLRNLVSQLMAKDPENRPQTAGATADQLARYARGCDLTTVTRALGGAAHRVGSLPGTRRSSAGEMRFTRRHLLWVVSAAGAAGAVGAAGALLDGRFRWWDRRRQLRTGQWRQLVPTQPEILLNVGPPDSATWSAGAQEGAWQLQSRGTALLHLGQPVQGVFALATDFQQPGWEHEVGLFFRFRRTVEAGQTGRSFQTIQLVPCSDPGSPVAESDSSPKFKLLWMAHQAVWDEEGWQLSHEPWADVPIELPAGNVAAVLQVVLGRRGFPEVLWNGRLLPESQWTLSFEGRRQCHLAAQQLKTEYMGHLGLVASGGVTQFLHPRLMYHA